MEKDEKELNYYTQRQWDRVVGYGKVPKEYKNPLDESENK